MPAEETSQCEVKATKRAVHAEGLLAAVRIQSAPPELVAAPASHVVASAVLDDVLAAPGTPLHGLPAEELQVHAYVGRSRCEILSGPRVLAGEAHNGVETEIPETETASARAVHLDF